MKIAAVVLLAALAVTAPASAKTRPDPSPKCPECVAVLNAMIGSLKQDPEQAVIVHVGGISGNNTVSPTIVGTSGNFTGINNSPTIDAGTVCKADRDAAKAKSDATIQLLREIKVAIEEGNEQHAKDALAGLRGTALDLVVQVAAGLVLRVFP